MIDLYLTISLLLILPTLIGMGLRRIRVPLRWADYLFNLSFYVFQSIILVLALWSAELERGSWLLPLITLAGWLFTLPVFVLAERFFQHPPRQKGAFLFTLCLSNHGYTLLGIVAFILYGIPGLAQATFAQFFLVPFLVLFCLPAGRHFSGEQVGVPFFMILKDNVLNKQNLPLAAMLFGIVLNAGNAPQPSFVAPLLSGSVYLGTILVGIAIGLMLNLRHLLQYPRENLFSFFFRQSLYPVVFLGLGALFGLSSLDLKILVLFGLVPPAALSNMLAVFFKLDHDLSNSTYIIGTLLFLVFTLPAYVFISSNF